MGETLTPDDAAEKIVRDLLSDLPKDRKDAVKAAIEKAMSEWGDLVSATSLESTWR